MDANISLDSLLSIIEQKNYGVEYQPIISVDGQTIMGYEALSRFYHNEERIPPDLVYATLHDSPFTLHQVELAQKKLQLAHAPKDKLLFVNLDQDSYFAGGSSAEHDNAYLALFRDFKGPLVVELIENSEINDAKMSLQMIVEMANHKIKTAIDDVCNEHSMLSTRVLEEVDYIKLDRLVVNNQHNPVFMKLVEALVGYAKSTDKKVILEGIETPTDLAFAKSIGVDFVQGFLFKTQFISVRG